jgi:hypothetical protein
MMGGGVALAVPPSQRLPAEVNPAIVAAVDKGLAYLSKIQAPDGSFPANWEKRAYPATMTSLAGMALMAGGSTPEDGPYAANVKKAMIYLLELAESRSDGLIAGPQEMRCTYGHGFAMTFLAMCYGVEQNTEFEKRIKSVLDKAIALVARGQSSKGGWLYHPAGGGDEGSTTACVLQGLRACRNVGLKIPTETIDRAVGYFRLTQQPDGGICYSLAHCGGSSIALSAAATTCFYSMGVYERDVSGANPESVMVDKLWRFLDTALKNPDSIKSFYFYTHFYLGQSMYQRHGPEWRAYYQNVARELVKTQAANGTWAGDDVGPTYGTALGCFILQLPYGYIPICER